MNKQRFAKLLQSKQVGAFKERAENRRDFIAEGFEHFIDALTKEQLNDYYTNSSNYEAYYTQKEGNKAVLEIEFKKDGKTIETKTMQFETDKGFKAGTRERVSFQEAIDYAGGIG